MLLIFSVIWLLLGGGLVAGSAFFLFRKRKFLKTAVGVPGVITRVDVRHGMHTNNRGFRDKFYSPTVRFQTRAGQNIETTAASNPRNINPVGKKVIVNYDERNPGRVVLGSPASFVTYIPNLIPLFIGAIFSVVGCGFFIAAAASGFASTEWHESNSTTTDRPAVSRTPNRNNRRKF